MDTKIEAKAEKFTPGPWTLRENPVIGNYVEAGDIEICEFHKDDYSTANGNLIAAAPDMYEALKLTYELLSVGQPLGNEDLDKIHAAISKANPQPITEG